MKKQKGQGELLREYLWNEKIHQGKLCEALGMSRQGLAYHFTKDILDQNYHCNYCIEYFERRF